MELLPLRTERLVLRGHVPADAAHLWEQWRDPSVWTYVDDGARAWTLADAERHVGVMRQRLRDRGWSGLVVEHDGVVIGECGLHPWRDEVELGYRLGSAHWGQGFGGEAAAAIVGWACRLGLPSLVCVVQEGNAASRRIAERLGFTVEAQSSRVVDGRTIVDLCYRIVVS